MTNVQLKRKVGTGWEKINPLTKGECVTLQNGNTVEEELSALDSDCFSPTITQISTMSKVGVGENDVDISANVQEGYVKSAILKGRTLVNLSENSGYKTVSFTSTQSYIPDFQRNVEMYKPNTKYLVITEFNHDFKYKFGVNVAQSKSIFNGTTYIQVGDGRVYKHILTTKSDFTDCDVALRTVVYNNTEETNFSQTYRIMIIEYQDGMENWDIPYFEGIQSVKLPVLKTTGKNLLNLSSLSNSCSVRDGGYYIDVTPIKGGSNYNLFSETTGLSTVQKDVSNFIMLKPNTTYTLSKVGEESANVSGSVFNLDGNRITGTRVLTSISPSKTFTTTEDAIYFAPILATATLNETSTIIGLQLEEGITGTTYEPYKSNILTVNEDVTLRGIGNVKDELDCLTGKVTERIGEIVLDGTQDMISDGNGVYIQVDDVKRFLDYTGKIACDKLPVMPTYGHLPGVENGISGYTNANAHLGKNWLYVKINNSINKDEVKEWLTQNPVTVQYQRVTESIKTVDLMPGGTNPTTKPYVWDGGHIQLSSEEGSLTPSLEYSVTTSRGGQIIQNTQSIAKQDKRVYDLEMLLINASIDEAYKRLTLQNDVMVMNRECQTVASPLRYIMLQRLIEEKAYETQDMLDKLDVFFMYGEITDEQYFELFDIVLGIMTDTDLDITEEVE